MAEDKKVVIKIESKFDGKGTAEAEKSYKKLDSVTQNTNQSIAQSAKKAQASIVSISAAINVAKSAWIGIRGIASWVMECIDLSNKNTRSVNMLAAAYQNVGYTAAGAVAQAKAFASQMQSLTGMADEVFLDAQRQLATFGVVGSQAQQTIQAAYALSVNQGMAFESALQLITRAATGSTSTLSRYGIVLDENVKVGEKFQAVLKQINEQFGASAQAAMGDSITKVNALKESWGDLKESVGAGLNDALLPMVGFLQGGVELLQKLFKAGGNSYDYMFGAIQTGIAGAKMAVLGWADLFIKSINQIVTVGNKLHLIPNGVADAVQRAEEWLNESTRAAFEQTKTLNNMRRSITDIWPEEKKITEEQQKQLDLNAQEVNAKRALKTATAEVAAEEKKCADEAARRIEAIKRNVGVGTRDTLSGWETAAAEQERIHADDLSAGDILAGQNAQFSDLQDFGFLEEQLAAQRDKKLEYLQAELSDVQEYEAAKEEVLVQFNTKTAQLNQQRAKQNQQIMGGIFSNLISLSSSSNKKLAAIGKAAAIAQATISTYQGAANALANIPWPLGLAASAAVVAAGMAQVANIAGVELANGGLVKAVTGGVPAVIGEGGSDEAVLPLDNARAMRRIGGAIADESGGLTGGATINVNINASGGLLPFLDELTEATQNGVTEALRYANVMVKTGNAQSGMTV